jgi:hypothetical protein
MAAVQAADATRFIITHLLVGAIPQQTTGKRQIDGGIPAGAGCRQAMLRLFGEPHVHLSSVDPGPERNNALLRDGADDRPVTGGCDGT